MTASINIANIITIARIVSIVPFSAAFVIDAPWNLTAALFIFAMAALTDFLDGAVARARNEITDLGAALDPLADKLLVCAALVLLTRNGVIHGTHVFAALAIILREVFVSGLREALGKNGDTLAVTRFAKWKTTLQLIACGLLLAAAPTGLIGPSASFAATSALWVAAEFTVATGLDYSRKAAIILQNADQQ